MRLIEVPDDPQPGSAVYSLDGQPDGLRYDVQFCRSCRNVGFPYYLLCVKHAAEVIR